MLKGSLLSFRVSTSGSSYIEGVSVVIPCLNERQTITQCVDDAFKAIREANLPGEIIVADNGSDDGSQAAATAAGARVVPVPTRGYGAALHAGILSARFRWVVFADADGSYPWDEIGHLIAPLRTGAADFVLGARLNDRMENGAMPTLNRFLGTPALSLMIRILHGLDTTDCNSGMRAFNRSCYENLLLHCPGMEFASEMLIAVKRNGLRYVEVPISFRKDKRDRPPHLRRWQDGWRHARFILATSPSSLVYKLPLAFAMLMYSLAFAISLEEWFRPFSLVHYHTAFLSICLGSPALLVSVALFLVRSAYAFQSPQRLTPPGRGAQPGRFILPALLLLAIEAVEVFLIVLKWKQSEWGALNAIGALIRITIYTSIASGFFVTDIGYGLVSLMSGDPKGRTTEEPAAHETLATELRAS